MPVAEALASALYLEILGIKPGHAQSAETLWRLEKLMRIVATLIERHASCADAPFVLQVVQHVCCLFERLLHCQQPR